MDYKQLLKKYMTHVDSEEGVTFVGSINNSPYSDVVFTDKEKVILQDMNDDIFESQ
jgi:hypothetical protein